MLFNLFIMEVLCFQIVCPSVSAARFNTRVSRYLRANSAVCFSDVLLRSEILPMPTAGRLQERSQLKTCR